MAQILKKIKFGIPIHRYMQKEYIKLYDLKISKMKLTTQTKEFLLKIRLFYTDTQNAIAETNQSTIKSHYFNHQYTLKN